MRWKNIKLEDGIVSKAIPFLLGMSVGQLKILKKENNIEKYRGIYEK